MDEHKTKAQLVKEMAEMRQRLAQLEAAEIERTRLEKQLAAIYQLGQELTLLHSEETIARRVLETALDVLRFEVADCGLVDEETGELVYRYMVGSGAKAVELRLPLNGERGIGVAVARSGQAIYVPDTVQDARYVSYAEGWFARSELCVPLKVGERVIGVLNAESIEPDHFAPADQQLLQTLADQAAAALENARLYRASIEWLHEAEMHAQESDTLGQIARAVSSGLNLETTLETIFQQVQRVMQADVFFVALYDEQSGMISYPFLYDEGQRYQQPPVPLSTALKFRRIFESGAPLLINRTPEEMAGFVMRPETALGNVNKPSISLLYAPLSIGQRIIGIISVQSYSYDTYDEQDVALLVGIANHAAIAIENSRLYDDLQDQVQTLRDTQAQLIHAEKMSAIGQLAAGIAHDFNNIMAVITLYTSASLRIPHLSPDIQERLLAINRQAKRASKLIQQILDFSRRAVLERRPMDLVPFLREQVRLLERTLPESIKITVAYGSDDHMIFADPTRMQQVVMNLALNARDAMPEGGELHFELARIRVEDDEEPPLPEVKAGEWVRLSATDTGTGIPPDVLSHIFEPFFTTKAPGKGSGLGLAQIHGIVKQHEGDIGVESQMGQGTTFHIYLPILPVPQPEPLILEAQALVKGQGETLLVVEDNPATRKALVDSLEQLDYCVLAAENGQEALAVFEQRSQEIALVLSDVVMPELGGVALLRALRQRDPTVPVVMLTGHSMKEELDRLRAQGLNAWMPKPPSLEQLAQVVAKVLAEDLTGL